MAILRDSYTSAPAYLFTKVNNATVTYALSYPATSAYPITTVHLKVYRVGNPGTITVSVKATNPANAYAPTGADLVTAKTFNGNTITTDTGGEWVSVTFTDPYNLVSGTYYAITFAGATVDATNYLCVIRNTTDEAYASAGLIWYIHPQYLFKVYDNFTPPTNGPTKKRLIAVAANKVYYESTV